MIKWKHIRKKRGLVDIIAVGLHHLFGVATDESVRKVDENLGLISGKVNILRDELVYQHEILKEMDNHMSKVTQAVNRLEDLLQKMRVELNIDFSIDYAIHAVAFLQSRIQTCIQKIDDLMNIFIFAAKGKVHPNMLDVVSLEGLLEEYSARFKAARFYDSRSVSKYYHIMAVRGNESHMIVSVPFRTETTYEVSKVVPFPSKAGEKLIEIDLESFLIFSRDNHQEFSYMSVTEFDHECLQYDPGYFMCPENIMPKFAPQAVPCIYEIVNSSDSVFDHCPYVEVRNDSAYYVHLAPFHIIYLPSKTAVYVTCGDNRVIQDYAGFIRIPDHCSFQSTYIHMDALKVKSDVYIPHSDHMVLEDIPMSIPYERLNLTNTRLIVKSFMNESNIPFIQRMRDHWMYTPHFQYGVPSFLLFLLVLVFVFLIILGRCTHQRLGEIYVALGQRRNNH